jgi:hypothetical protein
VIFIEDEFTVIFSTTKLSGAAKGLAASQQRISAWAFYGKSVS